MTAALRCSVGINGVNERSDTIAVQTLLMRARGDNKVRHGVLLLAPFFNARDWYWGAGFGVEDGMHSECSTSLIASFAS